MSELVERPRPRPDQTVIEAAQALADGFAATAAEYDRNGLLPVANFAALHEAGLIGLTAPRRFGGRGASLVEAASVIGAIATGDPSTALILFMQYANLATIPHGRWDPALIAEVLGDATANGALINSLRVEPELGSPARGGLPKTTARRTATGWEISGQKIYSTGSTALGWMLVWAKTDETPIGLGRFLVPGASAGITVIPTWNALGMRATASHDVNFDRVAIPARYAADIRLPSEWKGKDRFEAAWHAALLSSVYDGIARAARGWLVGFLNDRLPANLGAPLASLPRVQEAVGGIEKLLFINRSLISGVARDTDDGSLPTVEQSALVKVAVTENAIAAVEHCLKLSANHGISRDNPLERHFRDVLCGRIHTPQDDSALAAAGRLALDSRST